MENFAKEFTAKLEGLIPDEYLETVLRRLELFAADYEITKRETALVEYEPILPECYRAYMVSKKIEGLSEYTLQNYKRCLEEFLLQIRKPVTDIETNDIRVYLVKYQREHNVCNQTMNWHRVCIHTFFEWLRDEGYTDKNPCGRIKAIKFETKIREPLSGIEMEMVRAACQTPREQAIIETLYSTGCRVSELVGLSRADVDFKKGEVHLFGKGAKHRTSYINSRCEVTLKKYLFSRADDNPALFVSDRKPHDRLHKTGVERIVREIGERSEIGRRVYPHLIRHTTATDALEHGMNLQEVQMLLGHEKMDTTLIYTKICQDNIKYNHKRYIV